MLSLRAWNPIPITEPAAAPAAPAAPIDQQQQQQQQLVAELSRRTNMTPEYSQMCLSQVNWSLEAAFIKFQETRVGKSRIPLFISTHPIDPEP
jgi:nuclear RNA export factor